MNTDNNEFEKGFGTYQNNESSQNTPSQDDGQNNISCEAENTENTESGACAESTSDEPILSESDTAAQDTASSDTYGATAADTRSERFAPTAEISFQSENGRTQTTGWQYVPPKKKKGKGLLIAAASVAGLLLVCALSAGAFVAGNYLGRIASQDTDTPSESIFQMDVPSHSDNVAGGAVEEVSQTVSVAGKELTVNQIAEKCRKSSVGIMVESEQNYWGRTYVSQGVGSGFILSEDGYIATNNHVVEDADKITVVLDDGTEYEATLVGTDALTDLAVVKIDATGLPVMERGNSDEVLVGDLAVAIGTPASIELRGTVTDGIISAVDRKVDITDSNGKVTKTMTLIQTNATINPGNSGGPLINRYGQVIGINTLKLTDQYEGIGFAIPINGAIKIMNQLISDGTVTDRTDSQVVGSPSIGIQCTDISEQEAEYYGVPQGALVFQINKASSAAKAGLRRGDIIVAFEGETVTSADEVIEIKNRYHAGDEVTITVYRDSDNENVDITFTLDMQQ